MKVCGITRPEDAEAAAGLGAGAIGLVFWPSSPRFIEPERARRIVEMLDPFVMPIGVFVDQPPEYVYQVAQFVGLGGVQLHGNEDPNAYMVCRRVLKAVPVGPSFHAERALESIPTDVMVLLDAHDPVRRGGTGTTIDWNSAAEAARLRPIVLSGGLHAGNVRQAVDVVRPQGVDVSSGVESAPGVKDADRMRAFFAALG